MTSKELAKIIGVSQATVSLVINQKPGISEKTRTHVTNELIRLGYGDLIKSSGTHIDAGSAISKTIGFVLYRNEGKMLGLNAFYPLFLDAVENTARQLGYHLLVINMERENAHLQTRYLTDSGCLGYVIFATEMHAEDLSVFEQLGLPFVIMDNYFIDRETNSVTVNNEQGCYLAIRHLLEMGHEKIGYLSSGLAINSFEERRAFSRSIVKTLTGSDLDRWFYTIGYPIDEAAEGMRTLLSTEAADLPTAFLADNDLVAIGAMQACKEHGLRVPDDISFVGNADRPISALTEPKLTTIGIPHNRFGSEAVEQLIRQLEGKTDSYVRISVNGNLIVRESVAKRN